ncbi:hypothetical protein [Acinetobacter towneri]|uniref:hypothetical protein n=1 Tax=Acinetobacter towneri TaxID=202956 RepID=UPI001F218F6F|nr:hypothetical protein [Acinetobacter towneri]UIP25691.1 hypothetical protein LZG54_02930 [Acinetobacter towneri]
MKKKEISLKFSAVALAVLLAGCGGGGSDGYYGGGDSNSTGSTENQNPSTPVSELPEVATSTNAFTQLNSSKPSLLLSGDKTVLQVQLLASATGGAWADEEISLQLVDAKELGVSFAPGKATTDENGFVTFNLTLDTSNVNESTKSQLLNTGIKLNILNSKGASLGSHLLKVVENEEQKAQYDLVVSANKNELSLTGDNAIVTVRAVDLNGGSLQGKTVTLSLKDYTHVRLESASSLITDSFGDAKFKISLLPTTGNAADLLKLNGIDVEATIKDEKGVTVTQPFELKVVDGFTPTPVGQITLGNAALLSKSSDQVYYTEKFSAQVVDADGKPIKTPQKVTMKVDIISSVTGYFLTQAEISALRSQDALIFEQNRILPIQNEVSMLELNKARLQADIDKLDPNSATYDSDKRALENQITEINYNILVKNTETSALKARLDLVNKITIPSRVQWECGINPTTQLATSLVDQTNQSLGSQYEYTTDTTGKFDFNINYQRRYARWQTVLLTASAQRADGTKIESTMTYALGALKEDIDAATGQPFDVSPFNRTVADNCNYIKPWTSLLN